MSADERVRGTARELGLRTQLVAYEAIGWVQARLGDPVARLLHRPWREDPYPVYRALRRRGPLVRSRLGMWVASTHEMCEAVLRDRRFGVRTAEGAAPQPLTEAAGLDRRCWGSTRPTTRACAGWPPPRSDRAGSRPTGSASPASPRNWWTPPATGTGSTSSGTSPHRCPSR